MASVPGLREIGTCGNEYRLGRRVYHHGPRTAGSRGSLPACLHVFCRRGAHGHEYGARLGRLARKRHSRRTAALLVAH